ncbi:uncharacterized protein LOC111072609 [Drosophila obscura]|uniref:uncharacterized protein LOC111072609 n=1 Tax=Drosophila obscura TaxID=7282 RepID=UPI001BB16F47|nr:uncharacterized protein LOC111072609 [Drosophila obscura]XP_022220282.2 uncharacterized protein LOC111072609 [Drosophila obscura]
MPHHQYVEHKYTRWIMLVLRLLWSHAYLWVMLHAANVVPKVNEHLESSGLWSHDHKILLSYKSQIGFSLRGEILFLFKSTGVALFLYLYSRCSFYGYCVTRKMWDTFPYPLLMLIVPYLASFLYQWIKSVLITFWTLAILIGICDGDSMRYLFLEFAKVLFFKILVLANFSAISLRTWALLKILDEEPEQGIVNFSNLGEHLNVFLRI